MSQHQPKSLIANVGSNTYIIRPDLPEVGAYLYVFENEGRDVGDYLQDTIQICIEFAFEEFAVPMDAWREKEDDLPKTQD